MFALILILILIAVTVFTALLESFFTPDDLSQMGIHLDYSPTGRSNDRSTGRSTNITPGRLPRPEPGQETPTRPRSQAT